MPSGRRFCALSGCALRRAAVARQAEALAKSIRRCGDPSVAAYLAGIARAAAGVRAATPGASEPASPAAAGKAEEAIVEALTLTVKKLARSPGHPPTPPDHPPSAAPSLDSTLDAGRFAQELENEVLREELEQYKRAVAEGEAQLKAAQVEAATARKAAREEAERELAKEACALCSAPRVGMRCATCAPGLLLSRNLCFPSHPLRRWAIRSQMELLRRQQGATAAALEAAAGAPAPPSPPLGEMSLESLRDELEVLREGQADAALARREAAELRERLKRSEADLAVTLERLAAHASAGMGPAHAGSADAGDRANIGAALQARARAAAQPRHTPPRTHRPPQRVSLHLPSTPFSHRRRPSCGCTRRRSAPRPPTASAPWRTTALGRRGRRLAG